MRIAGSDEKEKKKTNNGQRKKYTGTARYRRMHHKKSPLEVCVEPTQTAVYDYPHLAVLASMKRRAVPSDVVSNKKKRGKRQQRTSSPLSSWCTAPLTPPYFFCIVLPHSKDYINPPKEMLRD